MKYSVIVLSALLAGFSASAATIAEWDLSKSLKSADGKYELTPRDVKFIGAATADGLTFMAPDKDISAGLSIVKGSKLPTPKEAFELDMTFEVDFTKFSPNTKRKSCVLWDTKYYFNSSVNSPRSRNTGFMVNLKVSKGAVAPSLLLGFGNRTVVANGKWFTPKGPAKLTVGYDPQGMATFAWNDGKKEICEFEAGKLAPASYPLTIGDRYSSSRSPFAGKISKIALRTVEPIKLGGCKMVEPPRPIPAPPALPPVPADKKLVAEWDFNGTLRTTNQKHELRLRGASQVVKAGNTGALYVNPPARSVTNKASGAGAAVNNVALSPAGNFRVQMSVMLDGAYHKAHKGHEKMVLWDSKYVPFPGLNKSGNSGMMLEMDSAGDDHYSLSLNVGYGKFSATAGSGLLLMDVDKWYNLEVDFNTAGVVEFFCDGKSIGACRMPFGPMAKAERAPVFGDRISSGHRAFDGFIGNVRLSAAPAVETAVTMNPESRGAFLRSEKDKALTLHVNTLKNEIKDAALVVRGENGYQQEFAVSAAPAAPGKVTVPVDTALLPGKYTFKTVLKDAANKVLAQNEVPYYIVAQPTPVFPLMMWGSDTTSRLLDHGFTEKNSTFFPNSGELGTQNRAAAFQRLDNALVNGMGLWERIGPKYRFLTKKRYLRTNKDGKTWNALEASNPAVVEEYTRIAEEVAKVYGEHPAFTGVLSNSEIRGNSGLSWGGQEPENFRKEAGFPIPAGITGRSPLPHRLINGFPWDRVIKRDSPEMIFYRWIWKKGDGWNDLHTAISEAYHKHIKRENFLSYYDPATRVPPLWGSGGKVDALNQWTYTNPDPIKIGQATDEIVAMAQGVPGQKVYSMTQAIWYRSATAPIGVVPANEPAWVKDEPKASYISIPEDALTIALWSKISRRIDGIMYHGSGSLLSRGLGGGYRLTDRRAAKALAKISKEVVRPLGPIIPLIPERKVEVALLESFASALYAPTHFPSGWSNHWVADIHLAMQWANIPPAILYEEHLLDSKYTRDLKVLVLPGMEVVDEVILAKLRELRKKGVILVGDEFTAPAIMVDVRINSIRRDSRDPEGSKKAFQNLGMQIRNAISRSYTPGVSSSSPDLVVRRRGCDKADFVFVVNDKRTFGDYLGPWKRVMEKGVPMAGTVKVNHAAAAAYDLVKHCAIELKKGKNVSAFDVKLKGGAGTLVLLLEKAIKSVEVQAPAAVSKGEEFAVTVKVLNTAGEAVPACLPQEVTLTDDKGNKLPGSGYYPAQKGTLEFKDVCASNLDSKTVKFTVKCLASGKVVSKVMSVK